LIEVGESAPDFTLRDQDAEKVSLSDYRGRKVLLVFYPADFSPVCNDQLSVYQEVLGELRERGVELLGISVDGVWTHKAFRDSLGLEIPLLADFHPKGEVATAYGAYLERWGTSNRSLVLVDEAGKVVWAHAEETPLTIPGANLIFDALAVAA
jgi:peroxiredoxin